MNRRHFLRGASGTLVGLPMLASLSPRTSRAAGDGDCRLLVISLTQGCLVDEMATAGATEADFTLGPQLEPLAAHRDSMLIVRGINDDSCKLDSYNAHTTNRVHALTARGMIWSASGGAPTSAGGISIDQHIAELWEEQLGPTPYRSLEFGVGAKPQTTQAVSWAGIDQPLPADNSPANMFDRIFQDFETPDPVAFERQKDNRSLVLDAVKDNFELVRNDLSAADQIALDLHAERVTGLQKTIESLSFCTPPDAPGAAASPAETADLQSQLLVTALECGLTRVANLVIGEFGWGGYGVNYSADSYHNTVHTGPTTPERRAALRGSYTWNYQRVANVLDLLASTNDGQGGNLLDSTIVMVSNDFSTGSSHSYANKDFLLFGGAATGLSTGRLLDRTGHTTNDLFTALIHVAGGDDACFGDSSYFSAPVGGLVG